MHYLTSFAASTSLLLTLSVTTSAASGDWPQWRGAARDGMSTETSLLKTWPEGGPSLAWKVTGLGDGYSAVAVVSDRIYTAGDKDGTSQVIALNRADGKQIWSVKLGKAGPVGNPKFEGPRGTPSVAGNLVFGLSQWGELVCLDAATGAEKWRKDLVQDFGGVRPNWGFAESPLLDGDKVIVTPGGAQGALVALNQKTGAVVWQSKEFTDAPHYSSLIAAEIGGVRQYIQLTAASVAGIAAADGKLLWRAPRRGQTAVIPTPIYSDGLVYVSSGYNIGCNLFKVTAADGKFTAEEVWANKTMVNQHGGIIKVGNQVYGYSDGKGWTCQDFKTGEAKWQEKEKVGKGSVAFADGQLYLRQEGGKGTVVLIEASPDGFKQHGRFDQPDRSSKNSWAHPVVVDGKLYLRDQDVLLCYDVKGK